MKLKVPIKFLKLHKFEVVVRSEKRGVFFFWRKRGLVTKDDEMLLQLEQPKMRQTYSTYWHSILHLLKIYK